MGEGKRKYRERLLRQIRTTEPAELAREILTRLRFRKSFLLEEYLDRCDRLISATPKEALVLARQAPDYARLTGFEEGTHNDPRWEARAWAVLGSAYRGASRFHAAEEAFGKAAKLKGSADDYFSLLGRMAVLRTEQRRFQEAISLADQAVAYFQERHDPKCDEQERDKYSLASALAIRGFTRCQAYYQGQDLDITIAAIDYVTALEVSTKATPRARLNALKSLISILCLGWLGEDLGAKLQPSRIDRNFDSLLKNIKESDGRQSIPYAEALWIRATARVRIAGSMMVPRAECLFIESRELFMKLGQWEKFAHITVEMAWWYLQSAEWPKAKAVLEPLLASEISGNYPDRWIAAIQSWLRVESLEAAAKVLETVRGCKVRLPEKEETSVRRGRWVSGGIW